MAAPKPNDTTVNQATIRWNLSKLAPVAESPDGWVYRAEREDRTLAALIVSKSSDDRAVENKARLLEWYRGDGAVRCLGAHGECLLLEWAEGRSMAEAAREGKDGQATAALANLVGMLHVPRPDPPDALTPLHEHFGDFFAADVRLWPDTARDLYARSVGIAYSLSDKPQAEIPLHGNAHHDRIVLVERGWIALAPIGLSGDPAYDLAPAFLHPWGATKLGADPVRINAMADQFEKRLGYKRKRILGFAAVHAAHAACRALATGESINWHLAVLPNLLAVYDAA